MPVPLLLYMGTAANQLDSKLCQTLAPSVRPALVDTERNTGADGHRQFIRRSRLPSMMLGPDTWQGLPVQVAPLSQSNSGWALPYQGVLGYPFLSQNKVVNFHYGRQQLYSLTPTQP